MGLNEYIEIAIRQRVLLAVAVLLGVLAGAGTSTLVADQAVASSDIRVVEPAGVTRDTASQAISVGRVQLDTAVLEAKSDAVVAAVADAVGVTADEVREQVSLDPPSSANVIRVVAEADDADQAVALARATAEAVVERANTGDPLTEGTGYRFEVIRAADIDDLPQSQVVVAGSAGVAGGIAGFVVGLFIAVVRHARRSSTG